MRSTIELYGLSPNQLPIGFKEGIEMQLKGAKARLREIMELGYKERDEKLVIDINKAIEWNERKLLELKEIE